MRARRDDVLNFESLGHIAKRTCAQCEPRRTEKILASSTPGIHGMRGYGKKPTNSWNATGAKDPPYQRAPHRVMGRLKWLCSGRKDRGGLQDTVFLPPIFWRCTDLAPPFRAWPLQRAQTAGTEEVDADFPVEYFANKHRRQGPEISFANVASPRFPSRSLLEHCELCKALTAAGCTSMRAYGENAGRQVQENRMQGLVWGGRARSHRLPWKPRAVRRQ